MGIFSSKSRNEKRLLEIERLFANLEVAKNLLLDRLPNFQLSPYKDIESMSVLSRPTPDFVEMDKKARKEVELFLADFFRHEWNEITRLHNETEHQWKTWILNNLLVSLRKYVPLALNGTEPKIASLLSQGMELDYKQRAYYIQRDISASMDGVGSADRVRENHQVHKHAEYLLLRELVEILVTNTETYDKNWLNDASWYFATLFCEYMQWSHLEGPFRMKRQFE